MDAAIDGMAIIEKNGKFSYLNDSYAQMYGYSVDELIGRDWNYLYDPTFVAEFEQMSGNLSKFLGNFPRRSPVTVSDCYSSCQY